MDYTKQDELTPILRFPAGQFRSNPISASASCNRLPHEVEDFGFCHRLDRCGPGELGDASIRSCQCGGARLCVEVDGSSHELTIAHDQARDRYLAHWDILTLRVSAREVLTNLQGVVDLVVETASARPHRQPRIRSGPATSPKGEER